MVVLIGLTWAFFQHLLSGIRHLVMDTGGTFELRANKNFAVATIVGSVLLTAALWWYIYWEQPNEPRRQLDRARQGPRPRLRARRRRALDVASG